VRTFTFEPGDGSLDVMVDSLDELQPGDDAPCVTVLTPKAGNLNVYRVVPRAEVQQALAR
jgi:hypothetical protein